MTLVRRYIDLAGSERTLRYVKGGNFVHWSKEHSACWSSIWQDEDDGSQIQIPNNFWQAYKIFFVDSHEK